MVPLEDLPKLIAWASARSLAMFPISKFCKRPTGLVELHARNWSRDPAQWKRWHEESGGCNFGIECGASGIIVVDIDVVDGLSWRQHFEDWMGAAQVVEATVRTPTGGEHVYYGIAPLGVLTPAMRQPDIVRGRINVRAGQGYVVAPWSTTDPAYDSGVKAAGRYRLTGVPSYGFWTAPQKLLDHCALDRVETPHIHARTNVPMANDGLPANAGERYAVLIRSKVWLDSLRQAVPGERNNRLNEASFALGKLVAEGLLEESAAEAMVWEAAAEAGIARDELKAQSTVRSGMRAAPLVGRPEPRSAMMDLLACDVPVASFSRPVRRPAEDKKGAVIREPIVERLVLEGEVTILSGSSGTGKTTLGASLAAASTTDVRHFLFGKFEDGVMSDVICRPAAWLFLNYEGGQHIQRNTQAWYSGTGVEGTHPERFRVVDFSDGPLVGTVKREVFVRAQHVQQINMELVEIAAACPGVPVVLVVDNVTAAVEDSMDSTQAQFFIRSMRAIAGSGAAVLAFAHPPKAQSSAVYGSHVFFSMPDIVGVMTVAHEQNGERTQWIDFPKHRELVNGDCLEIRSRRLSQPLVELPAEWAWDNPRARERRIRDLHLPYVRSIRVRNEKDKQAASSGVVEAVSAKPAVGMKV